MSAVLAVDFQKSRVAQEARQIRAIVRKADLTKSGRGVLMALVNLWFYHRGGATGVMHPGREQIAKKADCSVATVKRTLAELRSYGVIGVVCYGKGGRKATRYTVDLLALRERFDPSGVKVKPGVIVNLPKRTGQNDPVFDPVSDLKKPGHFDPRFLLMSEGLFQGSETGGVEHE